MSPHTRRLRTRERALAAPAPARRPSGRRSVTIPRTRQRASRLLAGLLPVLLLACQDDPTAPRLATPTTLRPQFEVGPGQTIFIIEDLETSPVGSGNSLAYAINNANLITGWRGQAGAEEAFLWAPPGTWYGMANAGYAPYTTAGFDLNDAGTVVGSASHHAARWLSPAQIQPMGGSSRSKEDVALAVNGSGYAVGWRTSGAGTDPVLWDLSRVPHALESDEGWVLAAGTARDINAACKVVGSGGVARNRPFHFAPVGCTGKGNAVQLALLPGDSYGAAEALNEAGTIVGFSWGAGGNKQAVRWHSPLAAPQPLGTLPSHDWSEANDINESDVIVGTSGIAGTGPHRAFRRDPGEAPFNLGTLQGAISSAAQGVNDAGHVVGWATFKDGSSHAVAWWVYRAPGIVKPEMQYPPDPIAPTDMIVIAILSNPQFRAPDVDPRTLTLGDDVDEDTRVYGHPDRMRVEKRDVNGDGLTDLRVSFSASELLKSGDMGGADKAELVLKGAFRDRSRAIWGRGIVAIAQ